MEHTGSLGTQFKDGDVVIRQGDTADTIYIVQEGQVEIVREESEVEIQLCVCGKGQFIGLTCVFDGGVHQAHARALGSARLITVNRKNLLRRMQEDPSLSFRIIEVLSNRFHKLSDQLSKLTLSQRKL